MPDITSQPSAGRIPTPTLPSPPTKEALAMNFTTAPELIGKEAETVVSTDTIPVVKTTNAPQLEIKVDKVEEVTPKVEEAQPVKKTGIESVLKAPTDVVAPKVEDKTKPKETVKPITPPVKETDTFDYTKYSQQEVVNLKNMSKQSREAHSKLIDEVKSLSGAKDNVYYQHEQGYTLSPDYQNIQVEHHFRQTEAKLWEQALIKIKKGEKFQDLNGCDSQGNFQLAPERPANDSDEIRIANNLSMCINAAREVGGRLQQYPQQFKQKVNGDLQAIEQECKARFAWEADPKLMEHSVHVEGLGDKKLRDIKSDFISLFPPYLANSVGVRVAANMMIAMQIQSAELREARNGQQVAQIKQQEISRGEPSSENTPTKTALSKNGIPSEFSLQGRPE